MKNPVITAAAIGLVLMPITSTADTFHSITDIGTPGMVTGSGVGTEIRVIQGAGVGFDINPPHNNTGSNWYTTAAGADYIAGHAGDEKLLFDLGSDVVLGEISVWGYASSNGNGLREFNVSFATDAEGGAAGLGDETYGTSITFNPAYTAALDPLPRQSFLFGEAITARYVEVWVTSNYAAFVIGGDRLGVGEIAFAAHTAVGASDIKVAASAALALQTITSNFDIPVTNTGELDLNVIGTPTFSGTNAAAFSVINTPGAIGTWDSGNIEIQFNPAGLSGAISATMTIASDDPDESPIDVLLIGVVGPLMLVDPVATLSLGDVIESFLIDVENVGGETLTISGTDFIGANAGAFTATVVPATIAAGVLDSITIEFDPTGFEPGQIEATLRIMSDDPIFPTTEIEIIGGVPHVFYPITDVLTNTVNFFSEFNMIDGSGVGFDDRWPHNSIGGQTWVTDAPNGGAFSYYDNLQAAPVLEFDLGQDRLLEEISTWGYAIDNTNGGKTFALRFATDAEGLGGYGTSILYSATFDAAFSPTTRDTHLFGQAVTARYVEMTIIDNWRGLQGAMPGGDRVGVGEVAFEDRAAITPGPAFKILSGEQVGPNIEIVFESIEGVIYELERSTNGTSWVRLPDTAVGGVGATSIISDTAPIADPTVLYRVINTGQSAP